MTDNIKQYLAKIGRRGGKKAAKNMTAAQRRARAAKAAAVKYGKKAGAQ